MNWEPSDENFILKNYLEIFKCIYHEFEENEDNGDEQKLLRRSCQVVFPKQNTLTHDVLISYRLFCARNMYLVGILFTCAGHEKNIR